MTGKEIKDIRETLGMTRPQFAQMLGVAMSTVWRWEQGGDEPESTAAVVLNGIQAALEDKKKREALGDLGKALAVSGGLFVIYKILQSLFDKE